MTRRTDWGEYASPQAPEGRGRGGSGEGTGAVTADGHGRGPYDDPPSYGTDGPGDGEPYDDRPYDDRPDDDRSYGDRFFDGEGLGGGDAGPRADDSRSGAGSAAGTRRRGGGDARGTRGRRGGRGERRRGFGESGDGPDGGGPQDGGSSFSSRAEKEESSGDPAERARAICLRLLTGTPRTRKQLADALRKREIPEDVADAVLSRFEEVGLINDGAFAEAWVESRHHGRGLAGRALARELRAKGVDSTLIDEAVSQLDSEQEETTARELVARKLRSTRGLDRDRRLRRLAGMLARKGYSEGLALRVVRQALEEEGEDTEGLEGEGF
ncbi:putative RecX-like regulatory protein [Streptomyces scabiei 87.22]|uniref:Regulatory protein RecX n=3 Tax=Streptomyces scabiei TaxID=1930 RepID=C9Z209_STRSW|nr:recombination regulator RecX [Streptomyces scabiei]MDX2580000.1 recombination regulator RecX [Streptomyces scabiei]MDX2657685.1 recombination regulator RecX [Streptomyces scabiei]MDX2725718.1 recombination regulator RecX [Streptomyces scabiei]MDX2870435.1 recombination regulator RecX [Streptomyces scabiei]MDX2888957.1 recombination regulator RecX [Streptomyces scabiei]